MPKVGNKHYPYTEKGMMMAKKAMKKMMGEGKKVKKKSKH